MMTQIQRRKSSKRQEKRHDNDGIFPLYESCFWSATSLYSAIKEKQNSETTTSTDNPTHVCPMCDKDSVVLIPLQENEAIKCQWGYIRSFEILFSLLKPKNSSFYFNL